MECLHGVQASSSTTKNGSFWYCGQNPSCHFLCKKDECYLFEKAIAAWKATGQPQPQCAEHQKLAKMHVVKDLTKQNFGRPFFVCADKVKPCSFWQWGDVQPRVKPICHHGLSCFVRKVKKEGSNKDRLFYCCPNGKESSCGYFEWLPEEVPIATGSSVHKEEENYFKNCFDELMRSFQNEH